MATVNKIAWLGLGQMGLPMARNLTKNGFAVTGYDVAAARVEMAAEAGVLPAATVAEAVKDADAVFTTLFDSKVVKQVLTQPGGVLENMRPGALLVEMSTISPEASAEIAELVTAKGVRYLRAPISGSATIAEAGTLSIFVSGDKADFDEILPVLKGMSISQDYVGAGEAARVVKLIINMLVGSATAALGETFRFGEAWGLQRDVLVDAVNSSIVGSRHYQSRAPGLKTGNYTNAGPLVTLVKDVGMVIADAKSKGYKLPIHSYMYNNMVQMVKEGRGDLEATVLAEFQPTDSSKVTNDAQAAQEIMAADDERYAAMLANDVERVAATLSPGMTYTHTKGVSQDKADYIASLGSGQFVYKGFDRESADLTVRGDMAVMQGTVRINVDVDGEPRAIHNRYIASWERGDDGKWRLLAWMGVPVGGAL